MLAVEQHKSNSAGSRGDQKGGVGQLLDDGLLQIVAVLQLAHDPAESRGNRATLFADPDLTHDQFIEGFWKPLNRRTERLSALDMLLDLSQHARVPFQRRLVHQSLKCFGERKPVLQQNRDVPKNEDHVHFLDLLNFGASPKLDVLQRVKEAAVRVFLRCEVAHRDSLMTEFLDAPQ